MQLSLLKKPPDLKSYYAALDFLPVPCSRPIKHPSPQERSYDARSAQLSFLKKPPDLKSYYAALGCFARALLKPCKAPLTTGKKLGCAFCAAKPPEEAARPEILLRRVRIFCPRRAHALESAFHHRKEATNAPCSRTSKEAAGDRILLRRGRNFSACFACHIVCAILQRRPSPSQVPVASWMRHQTLTSFNGCHV